METSLFKTKLLILIASGCFCGSLLAQRSVKTINEAWKFQKGDEPTLSDPEFNDANWDNVSIPHCWNKEDASKTYNYYQGPGWYRKRLDCQIIEGKKYFLYLEGALVTAEVYINGKKAGHHIGGYTAFSVDVTPYLKTGDSNFLAVRVDNSQTYQDSVPPYSGDFTMWGGLYRDVYLIETSEVHLQAEGPQNKGFFINTPSVSEKSAKIVINGKIANESKNKSKLNVTGVLEDAEGKAIQKITIPFKCEGGKTGAFKLEASVNTPHLWSPDSPYLYRMKVRIEDSRSGKTLDETEDHLGFRWFSTDTKNGFMLNGKPIRLKGVNRHQDFAGKGSALTNDMHRRDARLIKEMGANFIRIAHYPQDPAFLDACDREGIMAWEEIPVVNFVPDSPVFAENSKKNLKEMILRHYNHPSIVMWGYMNEVLLEEDLRMKDPELKKQAELRTVKLAKELDSIAHEIDPSRLTTTAWHNSQVYNKSGLGEVSQVIGWNIYVGNVASKFLEFGKLMDKEHEKYPDRSMFISEYGIGGDKRVHTLKPANYDYSIEYQQLLHESIFPQILDRKFIIGSTVWNFIDFGSSLRQESTPHYNNKGLTYNNRVQKDVYFYYQAMFRTDPVIHIASRDWNERKGIPAGPADLFVNQPVKIYSNVSKVELFLNGKSLGIRNTSNGSSIYEVPFIDGENILVAKSAVQDSTIMDATTVNFQVQPYDLRKAGKNLEIGINAGSNCFYTDSYSHFTYEPDQPYTREGSWGYVDSADSSRTKSTTVDSKSTIGGTDQGPLYQTMREGAQAYQFDVPDGDYEISLMFAAPLSREDAIVNNVQGIIGKTFSQRIFNVYINGLLQLSNVDLAANYGSLTAVEKTFNVKASNGKGVRVEFSPVKGVSIISALKLRRTF